MTTRIALLIAIAIGAGIGADLAAGWGASLFLARRLNALIGWLAVWR